MRRRKREAGYTLLEVLVATTIMAIAVTALVGNLTGSLRNLSRLTEQDRATLLTKRKLEEILIQPPVMITRFIPVEGGFDQPISTDGGKSGWRLVITPTELPERPYPGSPVLDRLELEAWWEPTGSKKRRTFSIVTYRRGVLTEADFLASGGALPRL